MRGGGERNSIDVEEAAFFLGAVFFATLFFATDLF